MRSEPVLIDARHHRPLPSGQALARIMRQVLRQMRAEFLRNPRIYQPSYLSVTLFDLLLPIFERYAAEGARRAFAQQGKQEKRIVYRGKGLKREVRTMFNVLAPQILATARRMTFAFLDGFFTSTSDMLRAALAASLAAGETALELQRRLVAIFGRERAAVIGVTESSRITHEGQRIADKEGGLEKRQWLCSGDCCDLCAALDEKIVGIDEPFLIDPSRGAYSVIMGPPYHPSCQCTTVGVF